MRNLIIIFLLLFAIGCTPAVVDKPEEITKLPEVKVEKSLDIIEVDMSDKKSVLKLFKRSGMALPIPFTNQITETVAWKLCQAKQKSWRTRRFNSYPDVTMKLYGKHPTRKGAFMCLPDKVTKAQATYYCRTLKRKLYTYNNKTHHQFTCIRRIK